MRFAAGPKMTSFLTDGPDFAAIGSTGMDAASAERQTDIAAESKIQGAGLESMSMIKQAAHQARGIEAGGQAQAAATRASGMSGMIGSIAGGIGSLDFSGGGGNSAFGGGGYGRLPENPTNGIRAAGITGPIYDFQT